MTHDRRGQVWEVGGGGELWLVTSSTRQGDRVRHATLILWSVVEPVAGKASWHFEWAGPERDRPSWVTPSWEGVKGMRRVT